MCTLSWCDLDLTCVLAVVTLKSCVGECYNHVICMTYIYILEFKWRQHLLKISPEKKLFFFYLN